MLCALPAHRLLPNWDVHTRSTLSPLNVAHMLQCSQTCHNPSDLGWPFGLLVHHYIYLFKLLFRHSTPACPPSQESAPSHVFWPTTTQPNQPKGLLVWTVHYSQYYERINLSLRLQFLWNLCDDLFWLSNMEKFLLSEILKTVLHKAALLHFALFPKSQLNICPQRFGSYHSQLRKKPGQPSQIEVNLLASVVFPFLQST